MHREARTREHLGISSIYLPATVHHRKRLGLECRRSKPVVPKLRSSLRPHIRRQQPEIQQDRTISNRPPSSRLNLPSIDEHFGLIPCRDVPDHGGFDVNSRLCHGPIFQKAFQRARVIDLTPATGAGLGFGPKPFS